MSRTGKEYKKKSRGQQDRLISQKLDASEDTTTQSALKIKDSAATTLLPGHTSKQSSNDKKPVDHSPSRGSCLPSPPTPVHVPVGKLKHPNLLVIRAQNVEDGARVGPPHPRHERGLARRLGARQVERAGGQPAAAASGAIAPGAVIKGTGKGVAAGCRTRRREKGGGHGCDAPGGRRVAGGGAGARATPAVARAGVPGGRDRISSGCTRARGAGDPVRIKECYL